MQKWHRYSDRFHISIHNSDGMDVSEEALSARNYYREAVLKELHFIYRKTLQIDDYAARLGELIMLREIFEVVMKHAHEMDIFLENRIVPWALRGVSAMQSCAGRQFRLRASTRILTKSYCLVFVCTGTNKVCLSSTCLRVLWERSPRAFAYLYFSINSNWFNDDQFADYWCPRKASPCRM